MVFYVYAREFYSMNVKITPIAFSEICKSYKVYIVTNEPKSNSQLI